ncbi:cytochrome P450 4C1-like isoform X2 [Planococcus citri]|uniref:cytochrome P450 4C1-like isoform X2 n=1 Tax=Planococcus citri TaxID=170843 RepID=UPI0031F84A91
MWFFIVAVFLILLLIYKILSPSPRVLEFAEKVPGPKRYSIIGTPAVFTSAKSYLYTLTGLYEKYGPVYRIWYGNKVIFVLNDPDDIEVLLSSTKHLEKPFTYRQLDSWLGKSSLLTSEADIWRVHRKLLTPSFHFKIVEKSVPMMFKNAKILCDKLESEIDQSGFDIQKYLERTALDIIGEIAMGIRINSQSSVNNDYLNSMKVLSKTLFERFESPWLESETAFKFSKTGRDFFNNLKTVKDEGRKVIHERRKLLQENHKVFDEEENDDGRRKLQPFLDFMLTQATFSDDDIENEVQTFMFAGHDTTKSGMSFCFYCLANHQEIQNKAVEEIREMLLSVEGEPTYNDFLGLKYLEMIIKESMRLYPPAPIISRKIDEDIKLPSGYVLPAGSNADISIYNTHRNAKYFKEPEKFIPERFEERDEERSPYAFIPFSAGPRNCMGQKFAMLEMRIIVAMLLLKYQFLLDENAKPVDVKVGMVLEPMDRIPIKIKRRKAVQ